MTRRVLVVGGTGPSGVPLVELLLADGDDVVIYHSGSHESEFTRDVRHFHGDPRDPDDIARQLGAGHWDVVIATSGRLRALAGALATKTRRFVGITGQPVYRGATRPTPTGRLALPVPETAARQYDAPNHTGKVAAGEDQVFEQHARGDFEGVIVRYPGVYGPRGPLSHEWAVVKRVIDGRHRMVLPHDGLAYFQRGYTDNLARLVYLAATVEAAAGEAFNAGDETVLPAAAVAEAVLDELGAEIELVGVPAEFCRGAYPLAEKSSLILDLSKARNLLGYRDVVDVETATRRTARWLASDEASTMRFSEAFAGSLTYSAEDQILDAWDAARALMRSRLGTTPQR